MKLKIAFAAYIVAIIIGVLKHEFWRDELHSWQIAACSNNFISLFFNRRYEGHPILWYLFLFLIQKADMGLAAMQVLNACFAIFASYIFIKKSPFGLIEKISFLFGYFILYEFPVIARNYSIGILILFAFCSLYHYRKKSNGYLILLFLLVLGIQTNLCVAIISISLFGVTFLESLKDKNLNKKIVWMGGLVFIICLLFSGFDLAYPRLELIFERYGSSENGLFSTLLDKFIISNQTLRKPIVLVCFILGLGLIVYLLSFLKKIKIRSFIYLIGFFISSLMIFGFFVLIYPGSARHFGHIFISFICFLWIAVSEKNIFGEYKLSKISLKILLIIQIPIGLFSYFEDYKYKYSNAETAANFIKQNNDLNNIILVGAPDYLLETIAILLKKQFYTFDSKSRFCYINWKNIYKIPFNQEHLEKICEQEKKSAVVVFHADFSENNFLINSPESKLKFKARFRSAKMTDENYIIFEYKYNPKTQR